MLGRIKVGKVEKKLSTISFGRYGHSNLGNAAIYMDFFDEKGHIIDGVTFEINQAVFLDAVRDLLKTYDISLEEK